MSQQHVLILENEMKVVDYYLMNEGSLTMKRSVRKKRWEISTLATEEYSPLKL